jgi:hypothetical protein
MTGEVMLWVALGVSDAGSYSLTVGMTRPGIGLVRVGANMFVEVILLETCLRDWGNIERGRG